MASLIALLIWVVIVVVIFYVLKLLIDQIVPPPLHQFAVLILGLIGFAIVMWLLLSLIGSTPNLNLPRFG